MVRATAFCRFTLFLIPSSGRFTCSSCRACEAAFGGAAVVNPVIQKTKLSELRLLRSRTQASPAATRITVLTN
ncbi:hypothetical protein EMIT0P253_300058 [Pseudomonas sp. IT-P253]